MNNEFTKHEVLKLLIIIALDKLPDEYDRVTLEVWLDDAIGKLERIRGNS